MTDKGLFLFIPRYYYDLRLNQCKKFNYSECDGNENNFEILEDCEQLCKGNIFYSQIIVLF